MNRWSPAYLVQEQQKPVEERYITRLLGTKKEEDRLHIDLWFPEVVSSVSLCTGC